MDEQKKQMYQHQLHFILKEKYFSLFISIDSKTLKKIKLK